MFEGVAIAGLHVRPIAQLEYSALIEPSGLSTENRGRPPTRKREDGLLVIGEARIAAFAMTHFGFSRGNSDWGEQSQLRPISRSEK
jgi:hypothetical protein